MSRFNIYKVFFMAAHAVVLVMLLQPKSSLARDTTNLQLWNENGILFKLNNISWLELSEKVHYSPGNDFLDLKYGNFIYKLQILRKLSMEAGFRIVETKQAGVKLCEYRPMLSGEIPFENKYFKMELSNRIEYRRFSNQTQHFRYRQKCSCELTPLLHKWKSSPFIAEEFFFKLNQEGMHMARLYAGINTCINQNVEMKVYYALQKSKQGYDWPGKNIIGFNIMILAFGN